MARKATGQKVARAKEDAHPKAPQPVQAAGERPKQALLQRSCLDHTPCTVLPWGGTEAYAYRDLCSPTHLRKVQLLRPFIQCTRPRSAGHDWKPRLCLPFATLKY